MGFVTVALGAVRATRRAHIARARTSTGTPCSSAQPGQPSPCWGCRLLVDFLCTPTW